MNREEITAFVAGLMPEAEAGINKQYPEFIVPAEKIHELAKMLHENPLTKMDYIFCQTAADRKDGFHMFYHLTSSGYGHSVMLRVVLPDKENPEVHTLSDIWKAAEYYELEIFDLFGIRFTNHPHLRRIFLDDDWVGYPLRKDYKDEFTLQH